MTRSALGLVPRQTTTVVAGHGEKDMEKLFPSFFFFFFNEDLSDLSENPQISIPWKWGRREHDEGIWDIKSKSHFFSVSGEEEHSRRERQLQVPVELWISSPEELTLLPLGTSSARACPAWSTE